MNQLPDHCFYLSLGAARIREIKSIVSKLENCEHGGRAFQNLPRHMQRRAVSSNPKRLPRYLQARHRREGGANVKPSHRPRRKYRRRPFNLLAEYNRRQKEFVWLETHIWHAKRFHMKRQWGYALPDTPTFKGYRATLRAAAKSCLLQDVSYLCCIELEGPGASLLAGLSSMILPSSLALLSASQIQLGQKWTSLTLFEPGRQPYGALSDVDILWHPSSTGTSETQINISKVWIWVHPSAYNQVIKAFTQIFQLTKSASKHEIVSGQESTMDLHEAGTKICEMNNGEDQVKDIPEKEEGMEFMERENVQSEVIQASLSNTANNISKENLVKKTDDGIRNQKRSKHENAKTVNELKLEKRNVPFERTPKYTSRDNCITMTLLKDTLNRFQLTGPKSYSVLMAALIPAKVTSVTEENMQGSCDENRESVQPWWKQYYHNQEREVCHQQQVDTWKKLASCPHLPQVVLPLTVRDPRVTLPHKKSPIIGDASDVAESVENPDWPVESPLYDSGLRDMVSQSKEPDDIINKRRSQLLVPGSKLPESPEDARLPIVMMSRMPTCSSGRGSGWDIVMAAGWGMSVWMSLIFCGGVAGGQQVSENLNMEILTPLSPHLLPDTPAGDHYTTWVAEERRTQFFKRPPANRHNFIKLGVQYPFSPPWRKLLKEWEPGTQDIFVLRDSRLMNGLAQLIGDASKRAKKIIPKRKANDIPDNNSSKRLRMSKSEDIQDSNICSEKNKIGEEMVTEDSPSVEPLIHGPQSHSLLLQSGSIEEELQTMNHGCLVMVKLILQYKGTLESCAMICLPQEEDIEARKKIMKPTDKKEDIMEPPHQDIHSDQRGKLKEEHTKIKRRIRRLRRKARSNIAMEKDIFSAAQSGQSMEKATTDALEKVNEQNKVILAKHSSFREEMENAWLMKTNEALQCCSRKIMGYIIHGNFCQTLGRGAGIGWVALKPLLQLLHLYKEVREKSVESGSESIEDRAESKWIYSVLVRNPSSLHYHWAKLCVVVQPH